jgi:hypothetical protein
VNLGLCTLELEFHEDISSLWVESKICGLQFILRDIDSFFVDLFRSKGLLFKDSKEIVCLVLLFHDSSAELLSYVDVNVQVWFHGIDVLGAPTVALESVVQRVLGLELYLGLHVVVVVSFHVLQVDCIINEVLQVKHVL